MPGSGNPVTNILRGRTLQTQAAINLSGINEVYKELTKYPPLRDMTQAACKGKNSDYWTELPAEAVSIQPHTEYALTMCSICPVIQQCAQQWLEDGKPGGVWAGHAITATAPRKVRATYMDVVRDQSLTPPPSLGLKRPTALAPHGTRAARRRHRDAKEAYCDLCALPIKPEVPKTTRKAYLPAPHGTKAARARHRRADEPYCDECAKPIKDKWYRPKPNRGQARVLVPHGSRAARERHRSLREPYCAECSAALKTPGGRYMAGRPAA